MRELQCSSFFGFGVHAHIEKKDKYLEGTSLLADVCAPPSRNGIRIVQSDRELNAFEVRGALALGHQSIQRKKTLAII